VSSSGPSATPDVGDVAPDFALPDSTGAPRSLASLVSTRSLVLIFFRGHW
jgi:peroxiredoxin